MEREEMRADKVGLGGKGRNEINKVGWRGKK
jgi:hypothetical protein